MFSNDKLCNKGYNWILIHSYTNTGNCCPSQVNYHCFISIFISYENKTKQNVGYTKGVTRSNKSKKDRQCHDQKKTKKIKGQTPIYKTLDRRLNIEPHEPH